MMKNKTLYIRHSGRAWTSCPQFSSVTFETLYSTLETIECTVVRLHHLQLRLDRRVLLFGVCSKPLDVRPEYSEVVVVVRVTVVVLVQGEQPSSVFSSSYSCLCLFSLLLLLLLSRRGRSRVNHHRHDLHHQEGGGGAGRGGGVGQLSL